MNSTKHSNQRLLAAALRGEAGPLPAAWDRPEAIAELVQDALYHGVAGLLVDQAEVLGTWPAEIVEPLKDQARAQAMWEMRHREILAALLAAFRQEGIPAILMKGTAAAYDLYEQPSTRSRGDTDLLVAAHDAAKAKRLLASLGYAEGVLDGVDAEFALQQPWTSHFAEGSRHSIDLHWQVMNAPSLGDLMTFEECAANSRPLPRLAPDAKAVDRVRLLLHTCLHRAMHCNTPYFIERTAYYGSERLIWSHDIHLLAGALEETQWSLLTALAAEKGVAGVCLQGLAAARSSLGTLIPQRVVANLKTSARNDRNSPYLVRSTAMARAWRDIRAIPGAWPKLRYARARILPDPRFVRSKYPDLAASGLPRVYTRRVIALLRSALKGPTS